MTTCCDGSPGTARSTRKTSASLPVLRMPSSVSRAAWLVTTQSGRGSGPRQRGSTLSQGEKGWSWSGSSLAVKSKKKRGSRSRNGSGTRAGVREVSRGCCDDIGVCAPGGRGGVGAGQAKDRDRHVTPPLDIDGKHCRRGLVQGAASGPQRTTGFRGQDRGMVDYRAEHARSIEDPEGYWAEQA